MGPTVRASLANLDAAILALIGIRMTIAATAAQQEMEVEQPVYRVQYGDTPPAEANDFSIYVVLVGCSNCVRGLTPDMTVAHVSILIEHETGVPAARQQLLYGGRELVPVETLGAAGVVAESTIFLVDKAGTDWRKAIAALDAVN